MGATQTIINIVTKALLQIKKKKKKCAGTDKSVCYNFDSSS